MQIKIDEALSIYLLHIKLSNQIRKSFSSDRHGLKIKLPLAKTHHELDRSVGINETKELIMYPMKFSISISIMRVEF